MNVSLSEHPRYPIASMSSTTTAEQIHRLVNELYAAWSLHEPDRIDRIFSDDAVYSDVAGGKNQRGKEQIKQLLHSAFAWAPDFRVTLLSLIVGNNSAATEWLIEGIQTGPIGDLPASGNSFRLRGASILGFRDGKISKVMDYYDMATFLKQLGNTP
jgi:steroid delta-isomerase-like uncharacterized protein